MNLPARIPIFGKTYTVNFVDQATNDNGDNSDATIDFENGIIEITEKDHDNDILHTILHELFHGIIKRVGINQGDLSDDLEEVIVDSFATFLIETFVMKFKKELF